MSVGYETDRTCQWTPLWSQNWNAIWLTSLFRVHAPGFFLRCLELQRLLQYIDSFPLSVLWGLEWLLGPVLMAKVCLKSYYYSLLRCQWFQVWAWAATCGCLLTRKYRSSKCERWSFCYPNWRKNILLEKDYSKSKRIRLSHLAGASWIFVDCISKYPCSFCQKHICLGRNFAQALVLHQNEKFLHLRSKLANWDHLKSHIDSLLPSQDQWLVLLEGGWSPAPPRFSASPSRTHLWLSRESIHQLVLLDMSCLMNSREELDFHQSKKQSWPRLLPAAAYP